MPWHGFYMVIVTALDKDPFTTSNNSQWWFVVQVKKGQNSGVLLLHFVA